MSKQRSGQAAVEFALSIMVFLMIMMGIFDFGRAIFEFHTLSNAVREGARYAVIQSHDDAGIRERVKDAAVGLRLTDDDIAIDPSPARTGGEAVTIIARTEFQPITPLIAPFMGADGHIDLSAKSTMDVEY